MTKFDEVKIWQQNRHDRFLKGGLIYKLVDEGLSNKEIVDAINDPYFDEKEVERLRHFHEKYKELEKEGLSRREIRKILEQV